MIAFICLSISCYMLYYTSKGFCLKIWMIS